MTIAEAPAHSETNSLPPDYEATYAKAWQAYHAKRAVKPQSTPEPKRTAAANAAWSEKAADRDAILLGLIDEKWTTARHIVERLNRAQGLSLKHDAIRLRLNQMVADGVLERAAGRGGNTPHKYRVADAGAGGHWGRV